MRIIGARKRGGDSNPSTKSTMHHDALSPADRVSTIAMPEATAVRRHIG